MTIHRDIETVRRFVERELEQRESCLAGGRYVRAARDARDAFERIASWVGEEDRAKQLKAFDRVWPAPGGDGE